ncbi:M16 family metallopeptidase [Actinoplanes sp. GCM10030250]|uniref:M16 family metallopeptidase n=1 Tax=Actinoplanes sp. GCM10030250 TaxID=3273376 RepID=UPI0036210F61
MSIQFEVDGVPGLFAASSGPLRVGLVFRVGQVDEPLARRGITHLLEHLALHSAGVTDHHHGVTAPEFTEFRTQGSADDVRSFLAEVCASLRDLPIDRLPMEKELLRTEAASHRSDATNLMPIWRHGARGYGLTAYPQFGLTSLTADELQTWANHYFVRGNAALWVTGPQLPDDLRLDLPDGERQAPPPASSALPVTPAYFRGPAGVVVWDTVVPRDTAAIVFTGLLSRELRRTLRQEGGLSYTATADHSPRADGTTAITALADALPDKQDAALAGVIDVLERMRRGEFDDAEFTAVVKQRCDDLTHAGQHGGRVLWQAAGLLLDRTPADLDDQLAQTRAVTRADVARVAQTAFAAGLLQTPGDTTADDAGYTAAPVTSGGQVTGQAYPSLANPARSRVILGDEGASLVKGEKLATVRFDACAAVLAWPDGARHLIGTDGIQVHLEPTMFHGLAAAIPALDQHVPAGQRAEMAPRDPQTIPQPRLWLPTIKPSAQPLGPLRTPARLGPPASRGTWQGYLFNLLICLVAVVGLTSGAIDPAELRSVSGSHPIDNLPVLLLVLALLAARGIWALRGLLRLYHRR